MRSRWLAITPSFSATVSLYNVMSSRWSFSPTLSISARKNSFVSDNLDTDNTNCARSELKLSSVSSRMAVANESGEMGRDNSDMRESRGAKKAASMLRALGGGCAKRAAVQYGGAKVGTLGTWGRVSTLCRFSGARYVRDAENNGVASAVVTPGDVPHLHPLLLQRAVAMGDEYSALGEAMAKGAFDQETSVRYSNLSVILDHYHRYQQDMANVAALQEMLAEESDAEMRVEAAKELAEVLPGLQRTARVLQSRLLPPVDHADQPVLMEFRPGVGGSEAALFCGDLVDMYANYASHRRWKCSKVLESHSNSGSIVEVILSIDEPGAYNVLRHESGIHRVQRIPATETKGRIHTSTAAVVVLPKMSAGTETSLRDDERQFAPGEVRVDTYRSGGKGGQHVNTTDSAVRLVHLPTGVTVQQQDERSQPKNKAKAFSILRARLAALERDRHLAEQRRLRTDQVTTTDRSDKIRTYNYPQNRVTDHRCGFSLHDIPGCMLGLRLDEVIERVEQHELAERLEELIREKR